MAVLVTCMTKEYSRIYDLQRIKSRTKQRKICETEAWWKNWWPEEILIATFLSNKNIKDKKRNKRGIYDLFHKKNKSNDEKKFIYCCTVLFKTERTGLKVTYYGVFTVMDQGNYIQSKVPTFRRTDEAPRTFNHTFNLQDQIH